MSTAKQQQVCAQAGELACLVALASALADKAHGEGDGGAAWQLAALLRAMKLQADSLHDLAGAAAAQGPAP